MKRLPFQGTLAFVLAACCQWASAEPSAAARIPFKREALADGAATPGATLLTLLLAVLAIGVLYWLRKRVALQVPGRAQRLLRVLESQRLGARSTLSVVEFGGRHYLLAQGEQGVQCIADVAASAPASGEASDAS
jgi:flagellar biogenesis protein FliO